MVGIRSISLPLSSAAAPPTQVQVDAAPRSDGDEPLLKLVPLQGTTPQEQDRVAARTHYAHAQLLLRRGLLHAGWHELARAHRLDPRVPSITLQLIRAAYDAQAVDVAVRYAFLYPATDPIDTILWPQLATYLTDQMRWHEAIQLYEQTLRHFVHHAPQITAVGSSSPHDPRALLVQYQLGRLYSWVGDHAQSSRAYRHVLNALEKPSEYGVDEPLREILIGAPSNWALMAESFLADKDFVTAERLFRRESQPPRRDDLLPLYLAQLADAQGRNTEALRQIESFVLTGESSWGEAPYLMYWRLTRLPLDTDFGDNPAENHATVRATLETALSKNPRMTELAEPLAEEYHEIGETDSAESMWRRGQCWPELVVSLIHRQAWNEVAELLATVVKDWGNLEMLRDSLEPIVDDPTIVSQIQTQLHSHSTWNSTLAAGWLSTLPTSATSVVDDSKFIHAYQASPNDADVRAINWSLDLLISGHNSAALSLLDHVAQNCRTPSQRSHLLYYRSLALEALGRMPESRLAAHAAWSLAFDQPEISAHWGWCLLRDDFPELAEPVYRRFVRTMGDQHHEAADLRDRVRGVRLSLSNLELNHHNVEAAEETLQTVLDEFPKDARALNDLAFIWADNNRHLHRALPMAEQAVEIEPLNPAYRDTLGWTLYRLQRWDESVAQIRRAIELMESPDGIVVDHLGDALWAAGSLEEAHKAWELACERLIHVPNRVNDIRNKMARHTSP
ncbi:MAG: hypothetical protein O3C60_13385 [Planctomycetota bacterium]|nr:hypothetical protein [Planctomycetota bacterium]